MRAISLFSGVGGFELGMQRAGIETVMQVEQDKHCLAVLERHWPDDHTRYAADGTEISDGNRYKMAGNGVVAPVAEWIGHRLVAVDKLLGATT